MFKFRRVQMIRFRSVIVSRNKAKTKASKVDFQTRLM